MVFDFLAVNTICFSSPCSLAHFLSFSSQLCIPLTLFLPFSAFELLPSLALRPAASSTDVPAVASGSTSLPTDAVVGIVIGVVAFLLVALVVALVIFFVIYGLRRPTSSVGMFMIEVCVCLMLRPERKITQ